MALKRVPNSSEVTISLCGVDDKTGKQNPTGIKGYYLGNRPVTTKNGEATIHTFQTSKGNVDVWGKTDLNKRLGAAQLGCYTEVEFDKMVPAGKGKKFTFHIDFDPDNTIDTAGPAVTTEDTADIDDYGLSADDEDAAQDAALAQAEKAAKVSAMLKNGGNKNPRAGKN
jgi:hypothetical protein